MTSTDAYPLTRGLQQLVRVNLLQHIWRDTNGFLIHPAVDAAERRPLRIADVATASGLWLCELAKEIDDPLNYELHGFDISPSCFIPQEDLPSNVKLHTLNATQPVPIKYKGQFDFVHVRLLQSVILNNDPGEIIAHCMELLRPGGYLQWEEFDSMGLRLHNHDGQAKNLEALVNQIQTRAPQSWIANLPQHMAKQGMEVVAVERKPESTFHHAVMTYLCCLVIEEYANFLDFNDHLGCGDSARKLAQGGYGEAMRGSYTEHLFQTALARKPEELVLKV